MQKYRKTKKKKNVSIFRYFDTRNTNLNDITKKKKKKKKRLRNKNFDDMKSKFINCEIFIKYLILLEFGGKFF
jgi:hypothetical protein